MYRIYTGYMDELTKQANKIERKCNRLNCSFSFKVVKEQVEEIGSKQFLSFTYIEVEGKAQMNDWLFVATVEHTEKGNIIKQALTDIKIPDRYRTSKPVCEHCGTNRQRKDTYIVYNTVNKEFKQVGKTCLKDFTNGLDIKDVSLLMQYKSLFEQAEQNNDYIKDEEQTYRCRYYSTKRILNYGLQVVNKYGYVKIKDNDGYNNPDNTRDKVIKCIVKQQEEQAELENEVESIIEWGKNKKPTNDYINNIKVLLSNEYISFKDIGILVSCIPVYNKEKNIPVGSFVGSVGDRIKVEVKELSILTSWANCFDGYHETITCIYKIVGNDGNIYTWKTSKYLENVKELIGTIKAHKEYNGTKQTELTRCRCK